jgi:glycosyltransferase involved in cell wall biosynthesis
VAFARGGVARDALDRLFARAAIFAGPARYEPFGLAALEAGRAGCALVLGDIASLREVWGDAAAYAAPDDPEELGHVLIQLIRDERVRARLAAAARQRARVYTPERMVDAYLDAYERLATEAVERDAVGALR